VHISSRRPDTAEADLVLVCRAATLRRAEYQFYRMVLLAFPAIGGPPDRASVRRLARQYAVPLDATLARMTAQDLIQRDPTTGAIRAAYPFSGVPTAHHVTLPVGPNLAATRDAASRSTGGDPIQLYAMCALDALGIPLMLHRDALITSADALTGEAVQVTVQRVSGSSVAKGGTDGQRSTSGLDGWVAHWEPATVVVYARPEEHECEGGVAAGSCCPLTNFFVTRAQAERWAAEHGSAEDVILSQDEALRRASALFSGVLERLEDTSPTPSLHHDAPPRDEADRVRSENPSDAVPAGSQEQ
jgi:hypothetical protein